ncbi:hypothetical protein O0235_03075 [Tepidiforma flava]|uniref:Flagellar protein FliT n=1 Tax=Tepidiforma flava TaxID=3004094 RepID=A0ABY7M7Z8_9CHLR|nr:hypothetical protein [Tepidiforma flava]WBL36555.1 hypothetical protein O0235_03075 [Tepidiforma flava]
MDGRRPVERALELARERLRLLEAGGEFEGLETLDADLAAACAAAGADLRAGDAPLIEELLAVHAAADRLISAELAALGARMRRLREGQAGSAAYRAGA